MRPASPIQSPANSRIGPRATLKNQGLSQTNQNNKQTPTIPTDIRQLGPPPSDVQTYASPFAKTPTKIFGKLFMSVKQGKNLKAGQGVFGRANPYVRIKVGHKEVKTEVHIEGGKNPVWDMEFEFDIISEKEMEVEILDKDNIGADKFMGQATVSILDWIAQENFEGAIEILDKSGSIAGELLVKTQFIKREVYEAKRRASLAATSSSKNIDSQIQGEFTDNEILEAFRSFDLDKNNYVGAAEIRHVLVNIGEKAEDEVVRQV